MNLDLNRILDAGVEVAQSVKVAAVDLADKGKRQVELLNAQNKLARAQRQLGALVYSLIRSGEENRELVDKYVQSIAAIEAEIDRIKAQPEFTPAAAPAEKAERHCPQCGAEVEEDALFCHRCGAQL